jgi:transposase
VTSSSIDHYGEEDNAIFYRNRNGCTCRALPRDFPPWRTVYNDFIAWAKGATWRAINDARRE